MLSLCVLSRLFLHRTGREAPASSRVFKDQLRAPCYKESRFETTLSIYLHVEQFDKMLVD